MQHPCPKSGLLDKRNCPQGCTYTGIVTVVCKDHFICITFQQCGMFLCQCSSKRSNCIFETCLMHGDHIHIAFADQQVFFPCRSGYIQSVEISAFVKNKCFRRIQIFRFAISHNASAKSDHPVIDILDRKNYPVPEFIVHTSLFIYVYQTGLF